jgi:hypothetical protein
VVEAAELRQRGTARGIVVRAEERARRIMPADPPPVLECTHEGILRYQGWLVQAVATGRIDARQANACSYALIGLRRDVDRDQLARELRAARAELAALKKQLERGSR